jgi:hypothetical protein
VEAGRGGHIQLGIAVDVLREVSAGGILHDDADMMRSQEHVLSAPHHNVVRRWDIIGGRTTFIPHRQVKAFRWKPSRIMMLRGSYKTMLLYFCCMIVSQ